jgi:hypothetical protein
MQEHVMQEKQGHGAMPRITVAVSTMPDILTGDFQHPMNCSMYTELKDRYSVISEIKISGHPHRQRKANIMLFILQMPIYTKETRMKQTISDVYVVPLK